MNAKPAYSLNLKPFGTGWRLNARRTGQSVPIYSGRAKSLPEAESLLHDAMEAIKADFDTESNP